MFTKHEDTTSLVKFALAKSGYDTQFLSARFLCTSPATGNQVHGITYYNDDGELEEGTVYLSVADGTADF